MSNSNNEKSIDPIIEWIVWAHLDNKTDLELILLKGHLLIETVLNIILQRNSINNINDYSFYRKIRILEKIDFKDKSKKDFITLSLKEMNKLRNKLAHEYTFDIYNGELELWSLNIIDNLKGEKYTKYTYKTKIMHSFSILTKNILELTTD